MNIRVIFHLGAFISFFLPWIDFTLVQIKGYEIAGGLDKLYFLDQQIIKFLQSEEAAWIVKVVSTLLYMIPIISAMGALIGILKINIPKSIAPFQALCFWPGIFIGILSFEDTYLFEYYGIGLNMYILFSFLDFGHIILIEVKRMFNLQPQPLEDDLIASMNSTVEFHNEKINELIKLKTLYDDMAISLEEYEAEKKKILSFLN